MLWREAVTDEAGERKCVQILPVGFGPKLKRSYRGSCPLSGPFNAAGVGSPERSDAPGRVKEKTRDSLQISDREELNDERGESPCQ